jgi:hypothetical protein
MSRGDHVLYRLPGGISVPMLAGDIDPNFARYATWIGPLIGVHVDHERAPVQCAFVADLHHFEHKPAGRRLIKKMPS